MKRTEHLKKERFLENYRNLGTITAAAQAVGTSRSQVWRWTKGDKEFSEAFEQAKEEFIEKLEKELYDRAKDRQGKDSVVALIFSLKALKPEKYREKPQNLPISGNITLQLSVPRPQYDNIQIETEKPKQLPEPDSI
jgi:hypothetical protein